MIAVSANLSSDQDADSYSAPGRISVVQRFWLSAKGDSILITLITGKYRDAV